MKEATRVRKLLLFLFAIISANAFSQEHWEDNFWRKQSQERYKKTFTMKGLYTEFYDNGQIKWQGKCLENGIPDSTWVYYDEHGYKIWEGEYTGKYIEYLKVYDYDREDGQEEIKTSNSPPKKKHIEQDTFMVGNYLNGLKEGDWVQYDPEGKYIARKGQYRKGEPTGIWQEFEPVTLVTAVKKTAEYNYHTQNRVTYENDTIAKTEEYDSLTYDDAYGMSQRKPYDYDYSDSDVSVNICGAATAQDINLTRLNNFFFQPGHSKLEGPVQSFGIEWSGVSEHLYWAYDIKWTPAISADLNDSIRLRLSGWNSSLYFGGDLIRNDHVDLCPAAGIGFQHLKLKTLRIVNADTSSYSFREGDFRVYKRSAFTANLALSLRFNMSNASLAITGGYLFDLSTQRWRYNGKYLDESPVTCLSGPFAGISFGVHIPDY